jgi:hypothetical protein
LLEHAVEVAQLEREGSRDTEDFADQYAFSTQPRRVAACR